MTLPLVLLHGWGARASIWRGLSERLPGHEVICPELRPAVELEAWADAVAEELPARCVLGGWSLGAMLAMCVAQRHPRRLQGLLLFAPTPRFVAGPDWKSGLDEATVQAFREAFLRDPLRTQQRFLALQTLGDEQRHAVGDQLQAASCDVQADSSALGHGLRLLATADLRRQLPAPTLPGLILHGEQDALIPLGAGRWLAGGWSASRFVSMPRCGHVPFLARPDEVADEVTRFLSACSSRS